MNAGRKDIWEPIAKALAENWKTATEDDRDSWDFGFPDREAEVARRPNNGEGKSMEKSSSEVEERPVTGPADYRKWARAPYWSAEECVALHFDKEPVAGKGLPRGAHLLETQLMDRLHRE